MNDLGGGGSLGNVPTGFHPPVEEYLKAAYELEEEGAPLIRARLAERLGHSGPTVTETVRRLETDGYLRADGRDLRLTSSGRARAEAVVRKHRLAECLLADVIGLPWVQVHLEAGRWEHVISEDVAERLVALLDDPASCPHGNPIPGSRRAVRPLRPLAESAVGDEVRLGRISERVELDGESLQYLDSHGFRPGAVATVKDRAPDGTLTLLVEGGTLACSPLLASRLYVDRV